MQIRTRGLCILLKELMNETTINEVPNKHTNTLNSHKDPFNMTVSIIAMEQF